MKKNFLILAALSLLSFGCGDDGDAPSAEDCNGEVCTATVGTNEAATTVPASLHGTYDMTITYAESNSPYPVGTQATFTVSENRLSVAIDGENCFSIINPVTRNSLAAPTFKADCVADIAFQVASNSSGAMHEINLILASGSGFYAQFTLN